MKYFYQSLLVLACGAFVLLADDFWLKKPFTDWSDKEAAKLLKESPWAHEVNISLGEDRMGGGGRGGGRGGGGAGAGGGSSTARGGELDGGNAGGAAGISLILDIRWQSAQPVREALILGKYGHEKADSEDARKFLNQKLAGYVIGVIGLPGSVARIPEDRLNDLAKESTALLRKGKDPIAAEGARLVPRDTQVDLYFSFPKTSEITLDDKEVEFATRVGRLEVRRKFKLKDMVVADKLAL